MLGARHKFYFVGKEPLALWAVLALLFGNTVLMLLPESAAKYIFGQRSEIAHWHADHSVAIQFVLLAALAAIFVIFRKRVQYIREK